MHNRRTITSRNRRAILLVMVALIVAAWFLSDRMWQREHMRLVEHPLPFEVGEVVYFQEKSDPVLGKFFHYDYQYESEKEIKTIYEMLSSLDCYALPDEPEWSVSPEDSASLQLDARLTDGRTVRISLHPRLMRMSVGGIPYAVTSDQLYRAPDFRDRLTLPYCEQNFSSRVGTVEARVFAPHSAFRYRIRWEDGSTDTLLLPQILQDVYKRQAWDHPKGWHHAPRPLPLSTR